MRRLRTVSLALAPALVPFGVVAQTPPAATSASAIAANDEGPERLAPSRFDDEGPAPDRTGVAAIARLPQLLNAEGIVRFARMRQKGAAPGTVPWTVTTGATASETFLCFEGPAPLPRCFTVAAPAQSFIMPFEPRAGFPLRVGMGVDVGSGDVEEMIFQLAAPDAEPAVALSNFVGTARAGAHLPTVSVRDEVPAVVRAAGDVEVTQRQGSVMYAVEAGMLSACERHGEGVRCTPPVAVAQPSDVVVLEPDGQGPVLYEVEVEVYTTVGGAPAERIHVAVFDRSADGTLGLAAIVPFGGESSVAVSGGNEIREVLYEVLEPVGETCLRVGRPEVEHRLEASGSERMLGRLRLERAPNVLPAAAWNGDSLLVDASGTWQVDPAGGLRRVSRCPR